MESFYGGRQGASINIVARFDSIDDMVTCFKQGSATTYKVNYGEFVIIDTVINLKNSSDPDNGKLYRRGLNYTDDMGGAEYIAQINGPRGEIGGLKIIGNYDNLNDLKDAGGDWIPPEDLSPELGVDAAGWSVTIGNENLYVFDYNEKLWYNIGRVGTEPENVIAISETEPLKLDADGVWVIQSSVPIKFVE